MSVKAIFQAAKVEGFASPYDTIHLKVFYPAQMSGNSPEQNMGVFPVDSQRSPFKVVIFLMASIAVSNHINGLLLNWQKVDL